MVTLLTSAVILGVISNLHCIGMCGPIAFAIPFNRTSKFQLFLGILQYNLGRILIYSILGTIVGFIGLGVKFVGILQALSVIAGFGIILYAWRKVVFTGSFFGRFRLNFIQKFTSKNMGKILKNNSSLKFFFLGNLNGLLPCGMVYTALITSIIAGGPIQSGLTMLFFGLGTIPGMILITYYANKLSGQYRGKINKALPYLVSLIGLIILLRGLNLGIPYLSPEVKFSDKTKTIESVFCHKGFNPSKTEK